MDALHMHRLLVLFEGKYARHPTSIVEFLSIKFQKDLFFSISIGLSWFWSHFERIEMVQNPCTSVVGYLKP